MRMQTPRVKTTHKATGGVIAWLPYSPCCLGRKSMIVLLPVGSHTSRRLSEVRLATQLTNGPCIGIQLRAASRANKGKPPARVWVGNSRGAAITQKGSPNAPRADHEGVKASPTPSASSTQLQAHKSDKLGAPKESPALPITSDADVEASYSGLDDGVGLEAGVIPESRLQAEDPSSSGAQASTSGRRAYAASAGSLLYPPAQRSHIRESWKHLMRWSKVFKKNGERGTSALDRAQKVVVFGGGSFGTAMGVALARQKADLQITLLLRDPYVCNDINTRHVNTRYMKDYVLPGNVTATTSMAEAIEGAQYAIHAVPVQHSRAFLESIKDLLPLEVPIISVSKGLELGSGSMMSELIPQALGRRQPAAFISGPSFAKEVMEKQPTGFVAASKDAGLAREMQELFASPYMRINNTSDVTGVEICGALKNVLAIAAGIVEGLNLGNNAMAALVTQGCAEIRWLAEKMGAKSATVAGLSGLGDIMLTCYGSLSRNRSVGVRLGQGEQLHTILASSKQVAEGVSTAGVVVSLARKYRVKLPVLTAVAHILDSNLSPRHAVAEIMNLPQIEER